jgi:NAD-dependent dihydropyrimidine dehydrogenase PreA subunit
VSARDRLADVRDLVFRMLPHRAPTGLVAVGRPDAGSPVLVTGNYALTVRRLRRALAGVDAWLVVADSRGINVWCAAGGGHLTHHDVIAAVRTSGVGERVSHRWLILPQLAATGVERRKVEERTGWRTRWGPARLEDLPAYLARGARVWRVERKMRFPSWERTEMGLVWLLPMLALEVPLAGWLAGGAAAAATAVGLVVLVLGAFLGLPAIDLAARPRLLTFGLLALPALGVTVAALAVPGALGMRPLATGLGAVVLGTAALSVDFEGTTPWYGSAINLRHNPAHITLDAERCRGEAQCVLVCPRDVLQMRGQARKVEIARPGQCIRCGACIVQCPTDALHFRYDDGRVLSAAAVRATRLNLAGRRAIRVPEPPREGADVPSSR